MWYSGDIGSAVGIVRNESKVLLVFGRGTDPISKEVDTLFEKASQGCAYILRSRPGNVEYATIDRIDLCQTKYQNVKTWKYKACVRACL